MGNKITIGETTMKYLLIFLIPLTIFAVERTDIRKAKKEIQEINIMRGAYGTLCNRLDAAVDKTSCNDEFVKIIKSRIDGMVNNIVTDYFNKAHEDLSTELKEEKCIAEKQSQLTERGQTYSGTETCVELQYAICIYDYTKLLVEAFQTPTGVTCNDLREEWAIYQATLGGP